jgi:diguanylate cyclase (GGDEF)-like protein
VIWAIAGMAYHYLNVQQELEAALRHLAESDPLTQILNRVGIMTELSRRYAEFQRYGSVFSVLMVDVDHFKSINDRLGHLAGDHVLRRVAGIIRSALREVDSVGRYGGEEFLVVLPGTRIDSAINTAERIRVAIEQIPIRVEREQIRVTVSIGAMAAAPGGPANLEALIDGADRAMYDAKHSGRNRVMPPPRPVTPLRAAPVARVVP